MKLGKLEQLLTHLASNYVDIPTESVGPPGMGKTAVVRSVIEAVNAKGGARVPGEDEPQILGLKVEEVANYDSPDIRGVLVPQKSTDKGGNPTLLSQWTRPPVLPREDQPKYGVVFLDEFDKVPLDVQKPLATFLLEGRVGDYSTKWLRWAASNRQQDRGGSVRRLGHMRNRMATIPVDHDLPAWNGWAAAHRVHPMLIGFANFKPGDVFADAVPDADKPYCTPRSFVMAGTFLQSRVPEGEMELPTDDISLAYCAGLMGDGAAADLMVYLRLASELPTFENIMDDPEGCQVPSRLDVSHALTGMLMQRMEPDNCGKLLDYISRMGKEFQTVLVTAAVKKTGGALFTEPKFAKWAKENQALVFAVASMG